MRRFLKNTNWHRAKIEPLAGDASFRRYYRLIADGSRAVLMDAPPKKERVQPFVHIARHLRSLGLSAPEILAADEQRGFLLLEDLGDDTFSRLLDAGEAEEPLYTLAVDVLIRLHSLPPELAIPPDLPAYNEERLVGEALLLADWYVPAVLERPLAERIRASYADVWRRVLPAAAVQPPTLVLRDFHIDNLIRVPGRAGSAACGVLDFQDAVAGSPAYDLMSLLEDARRDIGSDLKRRMLARYHAGVAHRDLAAFEAAFAVLAAQRHAKVIGIFTRLWRRDGKPMYLSHIPRVWRLLEAALTHPALHPVARWFAQHVPLSARRVPG